MSGSTQHLDVLSTSNTDNVTPANSLFDPMSPAAFGGRRAQTTTGLTWGYFGGAAYKTDGTIVDIANGTIALTASVSNYIEYDPIAGSIGKNTTAFTAGRVPLYTVVAGASSVTSYVDHRGAWRSDTAESSVAMADANQTASAAQARAKLIVCTGTLTAQRNLVLPLNDGGMWIVHNNTSGGFGVQAIGATGTGVVVSMGTRMLVVADGTNILPAITDGKHLDSGANQDIAYAAAVTPNALGGERITVGTLTGGLTVNAPTNPRKGARLAFTFVQDATGGRTITWNGAFKKPADGAGTANQKAATEFIYDGTHWIQLGGALAWYS